MCRSQPAFRMQRSDRVCLFYCNHAFLKSTHTVVQKGASIIYQALYRKYRSQTFGDVVGQQAITGALTAQIEQGHIGHAYLFTGTRGTGKTSCAKIFAKAVNCESPNGAEPCGECALCVGVNDGSVLDVAEIDAASNNGVDDVRELREETIFRPSRGKYRVYIIDEVHMLSTSAFNALLKILEEPPGHVIFILATTEVHKVPATILSRCQRFDFMRIPAEAIAGHLMKIAKAEDIQLSEDAADLIARLADGSMRDALSLLDTCGGAGQVVDEALVRKMAGVVDKSYLFSISDTVAAGNIDALLEILAQLHDGSTDARRLCEELVFHYRNLMLAAAKQDGTLLETVPTQERKRYIEAAQAGLGPSPIDAVKRLVGAMDRMGRSPEPRVELELALIDLASPTKAVQHAAVPQPSQPVPQPVRHAAPPVAEAPAPVPAAQAAPEVAAPVESALETKPAVEPEPENRQDISTPVEAKADSDDKAQPTDEALQTFTQWPEILSHMDGADRMLASFMKGSTAYLSGRHVLIDGGALFLDYVRKNEYAREQIKNVIEQVCGVRYAIGPYEAKDTDKPKQPTAEQTLKDWETKGVQISYE